MSKQMLFDKISVLGTEVDALTLQEAISYICNQAADPATKACYVVKPYVEFLTQSHNSPKLQQLLNSAELSIADGIAVLWAAHYLYAGPRTALRFFKTLSYLIIAPNRLKWPISERAAGTNFTWPVLEAAMQQRLNVFLIGTETDQTIGHTATTITQRLPQLKIVGQRGGHDPQSSYGVVSPAWLEETTRQVQKSEADLILVGMGFPLQEQVCAHLAQTLPHGVAIGEGGTFDYESFGGQRRKAPAIWQRLSLEWLWRLISEPKRWRRQLAIPTFIYLIWRERR